LPVAKRELHRLALIKAATSGDARFFLGTDSAPHLITAKESSCGCAGIFNVANAISVVTQVFEDNRSLNQLEKFLSINGALFYDLAVNSQRMVLIRSDHALAIPENIKTLKGEVTAFNPMMDVYWQVV
jgi:dihydroorotase